MLTDEDVKRLSAVLATKEDIGKITKSIGDVPIDIDSIFENGVNDILSKFGLAILFILFGSMPLSSPMYSISTKSPNPFRESMASS